jgi:vancomycin resistance protein YoaR
MKTATIPPVRVSAEFRAELDASLETGETLTALVEKAVSNEVVRRKSEAEFVRRGLAAIACTRKDGNGVPADAVIAKLEARLAAARKTLPTARSAAARRRRATTASCANC